MQDTPSREAFLLKQIGCLYAALKICHLTGNVLMDVNASTVEQAADALEEQQIRIPQVILASSRELVANGFIPPLELVAALCAVTDGE